MGPGATECGGGGAFAFRDSGSQIAPSGLRGALWTCAWHSLFHISSISQHIIDVVLLAPGPLQTILSCFLVYMLLFVITVIIDVVLLAPGPLQTFKLLFSLHCCYLFAVVNNCYYYKLLLQLLLFCCQWHLAPCRP